MSKLRIIMSLLVKNEADIIEDNIRFHAAQGVDAFIIMDNGSDDGTIEIIERLSSEFDISLQINLGVYNQGPWMTELAKTAKKVLKADLVISNDADEFWSVNSGQSLHSVLTNKESIITVKRYNFIQSLEAMQNKQAYFESPYKVACPILYSKQDQVNKAGLAIPLSKISPKVIVNPAGLLKIKGGNHRAKHVYAWRDRECDDIQVHHYPIRSFSQFARNIENRKQLLDTNPQTRMGVHYKRWVELLRDNQLEQEFDRMSLSLTDIKVLERLGVIDDIKTTPLAKWFNAQ